MMSSVIRVGFICTYNEDRSAAAEVIARYHSNTNNIEYVSKGTNVQSPWMSEHMNETLHEMGYPPKGFRSEQLTQEDITGLDLILCLSNRQIKYIQNKYTGYQEKTHLLGEYVGLDRSQIPNPIAMIKEQQQRRGATLHNLLINLRYMHSERKEEYFYQRAYQEMTQIIEEGVKRLVFQLEQPYIQSKQNQEISKRK